MESQNENEDEYSYRKSPTNTTTKPRRIMKMEHSTTDFYLSCYFTLCGHSIIVYQILERSMTTTEWNLFLKTLRSCKN